MRQPWRGPLAHCVSFVQNIMAQLATKSGHGQLTLALQALQRTVGTGRLHQVLTQLVLRQAIQIKWFVFRCSGFGLVNVHGQTMTPINLDRASQKSL